jgi:hypothetical protein
LLFIFILKIKIKTGQLATTKASQFEAGQLDLYFIFFYFCVAPKEQLIYLDVLCYSIKDDRPSQTAN